MRHEASEYFEDYPHLSQLPAPTQLDLRHQSRVPPAGVAEKQFSLLDMVEAWYRHKRLFFRVVMAVLALTVVVTSLIHGFDVNSFSRSKIPRAGAFVPS